MNFIRQDVAVKMADSGEQRRAYKSLPALDVIMCRSCKHWDKQTSHGGECLAGHGMTSRNFWCRDGEEDEPNN